VFLFNLSSHARLEEATTKSVILLQIDEAETPLSLILLQIAGVQGIIILKTWGF
jgi:hypothetical protein